MTGYHPAHSAAGRGAAQRDTGRRPTPPNAAVAVGRASAPYATRQWPAAHSRASMCFAALLRDKQLYECAPQWPRNVAVI